MTLLTVLQIAYPAPSVSNDDAWDVAPGMLSSTGEPTLADLPFAAYYDLAVRRRAGSPLESLVSLVRRARSPAEVVADAARRYGQPVESLAGLARRLGIPVESLVDLDRRFGAPDESGGILSARRAGSPVESLAGLARALGCPVESAGALSRRLGVPVEVIADLVRRFGAPVEALGFLRGWRGLPVESLAGLARRFGDPVEWSSPAVPPGPVPQFPPQPGGGVALPKRRRLWPTASEPIVLAGLVLAPPARLSGEGAAEPDELFGEEGFLLGLP